MFQSLTTARARRDPQADADVRATTRAPDKVDLGVGVYRDDRGNTPVMRAVKAAEARLLPRRRPRAYTRPRRRSGLPRRDAGLLLGET
jgi:aspartate/tyrosine/aromatic aminotransferase